MIQVNGLGPGSVFDGHLLVYGGEELRFKGLGMGAIVLSLDAKVLIVGRNR